MHLMMTMILVTPEHTDPRTITTHSIMFRCVDDPVLHPTLLQMDCRSQSSRSRVLSAMRSISQMQQGQLIPNSSPR